MSTIVLLSISFIIYSRFYFKYLFWLTKDSDAFAYYISSLFKYYLKSSKLDSMIATYSLLSEKDY